MDRTVGIRLNNVSPTPMSLRVHPAQDVPVEEVGVNLGQLFLQHYFDSFPAAPPKPDPSRYEYLELISAATDFRFHSFVGQASTLKKRALSAEIGQAFCRLLLHDHFGITYFAHLADVIKRPAHAALRGMKIKRRSKGDIPDYLCAGESSGPFIAEAKGRFPSISFETKEFAEWRGQFSRIEAVDEGGAAQSIKGYISATRFATESTAQKSRTTCFIEDPETQGQPMNAESATSIRRAVAAVHYARVFHKLNLRPLASALDLGYALTRQLILQTPVWTCAVQPFEGRQYIGGFYRTGGSELPQLNEKGWVQSMELSIGPPVFIGLDLKVAMHVAAAARGDWVQLDRLPAGDALEARGGWSSDLAWLRDGTVAAPVTFFLPTDAVAL